MKKKVKKSKVSKNKKKNKKIQKKHKKKQKSIVKSKPIKKEKKQESGFFGFLFGGTEKKPTSKVVHHIKPKHINHEKPKTMKFHSLEINKGNTIAKKIAEKKAMVKKLEKEEVIAEAREKSEKMPKKEIKTIKKEDNTNSLPVKKENGNEGYLAKKGVKVLPEKNHKSRMRKLAKRADPKKIEYIKTGIKGFDSLMEKGIPSGSSVLVEGGPGNGKTIFCLSLVRNMCAQGKKVLFMSFEEPEARLMKHLSLFGAKPESYIKSKKLYIKRFNALDIARSVEALLSEAKKELLIEVQPVLIPRDFEPDVVVIDSLSSIASAFSGETSRFRIYMEQLFRYLEAHKMTSFLIREVSNPNHVGNTFVEQGEAVSFLSDGIITLYNVFYPKKGYRTRALEIIKMRGAHFDRKLVDCKIESGKGLVINPHKVLSGHYVLT